MSPLRIYAVALTAAYIAAAVHTARIVRECLPDLSEHA